MTVFHQLLICKSKQKNTEILCQVILKSYWIWLSDDEMADEKQVTELEFTTID